LIIETIVCQANKNHYLASQKITMKITFIAES
jgi:hypothetical protein